LIVGPELIAPDQLIFDIKTAERVVLISVISNSKKKEKEMSKNAKSVGLPTSEGKVVYVNPDYVTSIIPTARPDETLIWVVGHAGYGTYRQIIQGRPSEVNEWIFGDKGFTKKCDICEKPLTAKDVAGYGTECYECIEEMLMEAE
jgi:hypothetical protein